MQTREEVIAELKRIVPEVQEEDGEIVLKVHYSTGYRYVASLNKRTGDMYSDPSYDRYILNIFKVCSEEIIAINAKEQGKESLIDSYSSFLKKGTRMLIGKPASKIYVAIKLIEKAEDQGFHVRKIDSLIYIYASVDDTHDLGVTANIETGEVRLAGSPDTHFLPDQLPTKTLNLYLAEFMLEIHRINEKITYNKYDAEEIDPEEEE